MLNTKILHALGLTVSIFGFVGAMSADANSEGNETTKKYDYFSIETQHQQGFSEIAENDAIYTLIAEVSKASSCGPEITRKALKSHLPISREEAAVLVSDCFAETSVMTDSLKRLVDEFHKELTIVNGRIMTLTKRIDKLQAQQFSTTTKLTGNFATLLGGTAYYGAGAPAVSSGSRNALLPNNVYNLSGPGLGAPTDAMTLSYDLHLNLDTSFTGKDLLKIRLESGNMTNNAFGLASATPLSYYAWLFPLGQPNNSLIVNRLYYSLPISNEFRFTIGPQVRQDELIGNWPGRYPSELPLYGIIFYAGSPGAYNLNLGSGSSLTWNRNFGSTRLTATAAYVAANGSSSNPATGGLFTAGSASSFTAQVSAIGKNWNIAAVYTLNQNGVYLGMGTPQYNLPTMAAVNSYGLGGYYDFNSDNKYLPTFNTGLGYNVYTDANDPRLAAASWYVGLTWKRLLAKNQDFGFSFGQPTFISAQRVGSPDDGNYFLDAWYKFQVTDNISITPALLWLSRPYGMQTATITGSSDFSTLAAFIKTTIKF